MVRFGDTTCVALRSWETTYNSLSDVLRSMRQQARSLASRLPGRVLIGPFIRDHRISIEKEHLLSTFVPLLRACIYLPNRLADSPARSEAGEEQVQTFHNFLLLMKHHTITPVRERAWERSASDKAKPTQNKKTRKEEKYRQEKNCGFSAPRYLVVHVAAS